MYVKLFLIIILGFVAAEHESNRYISLGKPDNVENSVLESNSSSDMMQIEEKMFANISNRFECHCNRADLVTKEDLEELKRHLIDEISALFVLTKPIDCEDIRKKGYIDSGIYTIYPFGNEKGISVRCDMDTSDGGWTVIQRRVSKSDFYKNWTEYEAGFGNLQDNFYIGNRFLHKFTNQDRYILRVDLTSFRGQKAYAEYSSFMIGDAETSYKLDVGEYRGSAGDALIYHNGMKFTTYDKDNDFDTARNCAVAFNGAWWYNFCHHSNLNGEYGSTIFGKGTNWKEWKEYFTSMKITEMKLRRKKN